MRAAVITIVLMQVGFACAQAVDEHTLAYWRFDEGSGTTVQDSSLNGNHGTIENAVWTQGKFGAALEYDGQTARVVVPDSPSLHPATGSVTVEAWIKVASDPTTWSNAGPMFFKANAYQWCVNANGALWLGIWGGRLESIGTYNFAEHVGEWHHTATTFDVATRTAKIYVDGELNIQGTVNATIDPTTEVVYIGFKGDGGTYFEGIIDELRVSDIVRTQEEIQAFMMSGGAPYPFAYGPTPKDGSVIDQKFTFVEWKPGDLAVSHKLYFGESFSDVNDGAVEPVSVTKPSVTIGLTPPYATGLTAGQTYYWRVDEVSDAHPDSPWKGEVWSFRVRPATAWQPAPTNGVRFAPLDPKLTWEPGLGVLFHTVYFGENPDEVSSAPAGGFMSIDVAYSPGVLKPGTTYYWRVDEFAPAGTSKGDVWSFTTVPEIGVDDATLLGWWKLDEVDGGSAVDWSGHDLHGAISGAPAWVEGAADAAAELNGSSDFFTTPAPADVSTNTVTMTAWIKPTKVHGWAGILFSRGSAGAVGGFNLKANNQLGYHWNDAAESYDFNSGLVVPMNEWSFVALVVEPEKATLYLDGTDVLAEKTVAHGPMSFTGGISLGNDPTGSRCFGGALDDLRFYTRVLSAAEIEQVMAAGVKPAAPDDPAVIESFDEYNAYLTQSGRNVWDVWADGLGGNGTGAGAGYPAEPFLERVIVAGNRGQSLPLSYDNTGNFIGLDGNRATKTISEISRTFSPALDLTKSGATSLVVWARGSGSNTVQPTDNVYLVLKDGARSDEIPLMAAADLTKATWKEIRIDLNTLTVNTAKVTGMILGVGTPAAPQVGGAGIVYIDDIRLTEPAPAVE